jgi:hypothetical protein
VAITRKRCKCGNWFRSEIRLMCQSCVRQEEMERRKEVNKSPYLPVPPAHNFEQVSDEETIWMLSSFIKKREDLGTSGPVMRYRPGDPGFSDMARQYEVAI